MDGTSFKQSSLKSWLATHWWDNTFKLWWECRSLTLKPMFLPLNCKHISLAGPHKEEKGFFWLLRKSFVNRPRMIHLHQNIVDWDMNTSLHKIASAAWPRHLAIHLTSFGTSFPLFCRGKITSINTILDQLMWYTWSFPERAGPDCIYKQPPAGINCPFSTARKGGWQSFLYCSAVPVDMQFSSYV